MKRILILLTEAVALLLPIAAGSETFVVELDPLAGRYESDGETRQVDFDLGTSLEGIDEVRIEFEILEAFGPVCTTGVPPSCQPGSSLDLEIIGRRGTTGLSSRPSLFRPGPFGARMIPTVQRLPGGGFIDPGWPAFLLTGRGAVRLSASDFENVAASEIAVPRLIVEGTPASTSRPRVKRLRPLEPEQSPVLVVDTRSAATFGPGPTSDHLAVYSSGLVSLSNAPFIVRDGALTFDPLGQTQSFHVAPEVVGELENRLLAVSADRARGMPIFDMCMRGEVRPVTTVTFFVRAKPRGRYGPIQNRRHRPHFSGFDRLAHTFTYSCVRDDQTARIAGAILDFRSQLRADGFSHPTAIRRVQ